MGVLVLGCGDPDGVVRGMDGTGGGDGPANLWIGREGGRVSCGVRGARCL